ncbi:hypothetical protein EVG20_g560 [Dentipellis fragilis]|uniref:Smr domain-containing protein n=1 Tax=Dentipellis fragilis TaxID=205917 RepID=A0A4Y9ZEQ7_9AGAM|nr:hypothetical protein EVG20_g560 [Dentipellis fragilis]
MAAQAKLAFHESLQREFCPPLDTTLLAALIRDIELENDPPTAQQVDELRFTLKLLAAQADQQAEEDEQSLNAAFADVHIIDESAFSSSGLGELTSSVATSTSATTSPTTGSPKSDSSSVASFSSPLGFLQAAFPHVPSHRLKRALDDVGYSSESSDDVDIVAVIEGLLTKEYLRDLEERGIDALEDEQPVHAPTAGSAKQTEWAVAEGKKTKKKVKGKTIALNDVRQQHHVRPNASRNNGESRAPLPDLWTQVSSLSSHLSTLLPSYSSSFFQSFFHSPEYTTPAAAVRSALLSITGPAYQDLSVDDTALLFNLHDLLRLSPSFDELDAEARDRILSDATLCLQASKSQPNEAFDIVWLLRDLDADSAGEWEIGPYHAPAPRPTIARPPPSKYMQRLPSHPPSARANPVPRKAGRKEPSPERALAPPRNAWNTVPTKKQPAGPHPLADSIPAYNPLNGVSKKAKAKAQALGDVGNMRAGARESNILVGIGAKDVQKQQRTMEELRKKRADAILSAGRAWQKGNTKNHGGEVAMFYAEQARELQEQARKAAMSAARSRVEAKKVTTAFGTTIDLHGTVISEAIAIVKEVLAECGASPAQPLKIITGRGSHSVGGVGVLAPAVKSTLIEDGWNVSIFDAGIVVRGRQNRRA